MDPVVHFELPAEDRERMAAFYASAFGIHAGFFDSGGNRMSLRAPLPPTGG